MPDTAEQNDSGRGALTDPGRALREARRAWFRAGVRRRDRASLASDLRAELAAAQASGAPATAVMGEDARQFALDWATARGLTDRRLRLGVFLVPALLAGVVAAGALLVALADAFAHDGHSVLSGLAEASRAGLLSVYALTGLVAVSAIVLAAGTALHAIGDHSARATMRLLAVALPLGAVVAVLVGVWVAAAGGYRVEAATFVRVALAVLAVLVVTVTAARRLAVSRQSSIGSA